MSVEKARETRALIEKNKETIAVFVANRPEYSKGDWKDWNEEFLTVTGLSEKQVRDVQEIIGAAPDGRFGPNSMDALRSFLKKEGVVVFAENEATAVKSNPEEIRLVGKQKELKAVNDRISNLHEKLKRRKKDLKNAEQIINDFTPNEGDYLKRAEARVEIDAIEKNLVDEQVQAVTLGNAIDEMTLDKPEAMKSQIARMKRYKQHLEEEVIPGYEAGGDRKKLEESRQRLKVAEDELAKVEDLLERERLGEKAYRVKKREELLKGIYKKHDQLREAKKERDKKKVAKLEKELSADQKEAAEMQKKIVGKEKWLKEKKKKHAEVVATIARLWKEIDPLWKELSVLQTEAAADNSLHLLGKSKEQKALEKKHAQIKKNEGEIKKNERLARKLSEQIKSVEKPNA